MIKACAMFVIVITTTLIGFEYASRLDRRVKSLCDFKNAFLMLRSSIAYSDNVLERCFKNIANATDSGVGKFFNDMCVNMMSYKRFSVVWEDILQKHMYRLQLQRSDIDVLNIAGKSLTTATKSEQEKTFSHIDGLLNMQIDIAKYSRDKNKRIYQSLGILSGVLICILLV